ncbi:unnamed protein product [Penicillium pancosmium]
MDTEIREDENTAINPNARIEKGLPMGNIEWEMLHYDVHDPYGKEDLYYNYSCLCKWEITPDQIVGHWDWATLVENPHWYEGEILPAFEDHNNHLLDRSQKWLGRISGMSNLHHYLPKSLPKALSTAFMTSSHHKQEHTTSTSYMVENDSNSGTSSSEDNRLSDDMDAGYVARQGSNLSNNDNTGPILNEDGEFPIDESTGYAEEETAGYTGCFPEEESTSYLEENEEGLDETDTGYTENEDCSFSDQGDDGYYNDDD